MKPANFPGRKNLRRLLAADTLRHKPHKPKATRLGRERGDNRAEELATLNSRILPDSVARAIRTKIWRGDRGKLR